MAEPSKPAKLSKKFQEFSLDDGPASPQQAPLPAPKPVELTKEDMDFVPYGAKNGRRGAAAPFIDEDAIAREEEEMWDEQQAHEEEQEGTFNAARNFFRRNREIGRLLDALDNLEMDSVITAGILDEHYRGRLPEQKLNNLMAAALAVNADNLGEIFGMLPQETRAVVEELHRMFSQTQDSDEQHLARARALGPDAKRVLLANTIAAMETVIIEMERIDSPGPDARAHDGVAGMIKALSPGVDGGLVQRAVKTFNAISARTGIDLRMSEKPGGVEITAAPDNGHDARKKPPQNRPRF